LFISQLIASLWYNKHRINSRKTAMKTVTQEEFEAFLKLLDPDRENAGLKYETIRVRLIKYFYARGCPPAEELADESIDRAIKKIYEMVGSYNGDPALYFYGVAKYVFLEFTREPNFEELKENAIAEIQKDILEKDFYECHVKCLKQLPKHKFSIITRYYSYRKEQKKQIRTELELELNLTNGALRGRINRIKEDLKSCLEECKK
jgi:DNA-directed RNA polymerase specialized sigma24 family protein